MRCPRARQLMTWQLNGVPYPAQSARLLQHLEQCADCRATWAAMRGADRLLTEASYREPPPELVERVLEQLPPTRRQAVAAPTPIWVRASLLVTAALGLLLLSLVVTASLTILVPGQGERAVVPEKGQGSIAVAWNNVQHLLVALGHVTRALWETLWWPWLGFLLLVTGVAAALWWWLWRASGRQTYLPLRRLARTGRKTGDRR